MGGKDGKKGKGKKGKDGKKGAHGGGHGGHADERRGSVVLKKAADVPAGGAGLKRAHTHAGEGSAAKRQAVVSFRRRDFLC